MQGHRGGTRAHLSPEPRQLPTTPNCGCHCFCHGVLCTYVQTYVDIRTDVQMRILMTRVPAPLLSHPLKPDLPSELLHFPCFERLLSSLDGSIVFYVIHNQDIGEKIRTKANQVDTNDKSNGRRGHPTTTTTPSCQGNYMQQLLSTKYFLNANQLPSSLLGQRIRGQ